MATLLAVQACGPGAYRWDPELKTAVAGDETYEVRQGDTLYSIAWRYGLDYRELAARNGIDASFTIYPGQQLQLAPGVAVAADGAATDTPAVVDATNTTPVNVSSLPARSMSRSDWRWPANGALLAKFGDANAVGKGIAIGGIQGDPVAAAADGKVVYAGSGLIGYGKIIIVKHSEEYLSAYGHNENIYVREGEQVRQGDRIASMGRGPGNRPMLHFEIRINGNAVDPLTYLPAR